VQVASGNSARPPGQTCPDVIRPMQPVSPTDYNAPAIREALRRDRVDRRARTRGRWWYPLLVTLLAVSGCWGVVKADQWVADELVWPTRGAQFVEVGPLPADPAATGGRMVIVAAGLNRKSGTGVAAALMPSLTADGARVFSLVYGSGINDRDLLEKFDAWIAKYRPSEVSFFGSSMGGDVVLNLAAHAQELRGDYRRTLRAATAAPATDAQDGAHAAGTPDNTAADVRHPGAHDADVQDGVLDAGAPDASATDAAAAAEAPAHVQRPARVGAQVDTIRGLLVMTDSAIGALVGTGGAVGSTGAPALMAATATAIVPPPRLGTIFLDCSPLGVDDVRNASRTSADALTALMEALDSEGGVAVRMAAELLGQQQQWSSGRFPFVQVRRDDLDYKFTQVWREKIGAPGISTQLIKDQYGVIRRMDIDSVVEALGPGARIVYFLPETRTDDHTVRVERVESTLQELADESNLDLRIVPIPGGHHASAESNSDLYRAALDAIAIGGS
jgi:hypothetical protein